MHPLAIKARGGTKQKEEGERQKEKREEREKGEEKQRKKREKEERDSKGKKTEETTGGEEAVLVEQPFHTVICVCNGEAATVNQRE
jgi:hypothetical protein